MKSLFFFLLCVFAIGALAFGAGREYEFRRHAKTEVNQRIAKVLALKAAIRGIEQDHEALVFLRRYYSLGLESVNAALSNYDAFTHQYSLDVKENAAAWRSLADKQAEARGLQLSEPLKPTKAR